MIGGSMRNVFLPMLFLFCGLIAVAQTQKPLDVICITEYPSTTFIVREEGSKVRVKMIHHNGTQYMPIWGSLVTPADLPVLQKAANVLIPLGNSVEFTMDKKLCQLSSDFLFACVGRGDDFELNGVKVHPWAISSSEVTEQSALGTFAKRTMDLRLEIDGKSYSYPMNYYPTECFRSEDLEHRKDLSRRLRKISN